jgi:hypothetical protein
VEVSKLSDKIGGFATIPNTVIKMIPAIGPDAFTLWSYLRYRTNGESGLAFPSYETIRADTGLTFKRIAAALRGLESKELMTRHKRFGNSTEYTLICPVLPTGAVESSPRVQTNKIDSNKNNNKPPLADAPKNADFESAWAEVRNMLVVVSPVVIEEFRECWQGHPDPRRAAYALKQTKEYANPVSWKYYKTVYERYDPDKVKPAPKIRQQAAQRSGVPASTGFKIEVFADGSFYG